MATFGPTGALLTFDVLNEPQNLSTDAQVTVTHIPGGKINYVDLGGLNPSRLRLQLWIIDTSLDDLRLLVGEYGTLSYALGTTPAVLTTITENKREYWSGRVGAGVPAADVRPAGWYLPVDAEFLLV